MMSFIEMLELNLEINKHEIIKKMQKISNRNSPNNIAAILCNAANYYGVKNNIER